MIDLDIAPFVTELRIYADKDGKFNIPVECRSDVAYGANVKAFLAVLYSEGVISNGRIAALEKFTGILIHDHEAALYHFRDRPWRMQCPYHPLFT